MRRRAGASGSSPPSWSCGGGGQRGPAAGVVRYERVERGGLRLGVAEELLDGAQVPLAAVGTGREPMPQRVGGPSRAERVGDDAAHGGRCQVASPLGGEEV